MPRYQIVNYMTEDGGEACAEVETSVEADFSALDFCSHIPQDVEEYDNTAEPKTENMQDLELSQKEDKEKKKKKKKKALSTICTTYCKFDIVRRIAKHFGMKEVAYTEPWNVLWTDFSVSIARVKAIKGFQRVNHFPGMAEICHKALLSKNLNRMLKLFPQDYRFFPRTWCFPAEFNEAVEYSKRHAGKTYILKPGSGCRGQGIQLTKNFRSLLPQDRIICQVYVSKPFLVDGLKFDLRVYTLIASCVPLRIYVYNEGLARFATAPYKKPAGYNLTNSYMHLTNYSVNKFSSTYVPDGETGTKRRLSCLNQWFDRNMYDTNEIWETIDEVIVKTIISAYPTIKHAYQVSFPSHEVMPACFELLGFDILLDESLKPYVLEVNHSPSFNTDSALDKEIKEALLEDTFRMLNLAHFDTHKFLEEDKKKINLRLLQPANKQENGYIENQTLNSVLSQTAQELWEEKNLGNYRKVYPVAGSEAKYRKLFSQATTNDTISSRVREEVGRVYREELEEKQRGEMERSGHLRLNVKTRKESKPNELEVGKEVPELPLARPRMVPKAAKQEQKEGLVPLKVEQNSKYEFQHGEHNERKTFLGENYIINRMFSRLKESGYIKEETEEESREIPGSRRPCYTARGEADKQPPLCWSLHGQFLNPGDSNNCQSKSNPEVSLSTDFSQSSHGGFKSKAAKEFLQFQKVKLLRQLQELV